MEDALPNVRCISCGKVIGPYYERFQELVQGGMKPEEALNVLELKRICCRRETLNPPMLPRGWASIDRIAEIQENIDKLAAIKPPTVSVRVYPGILKNVRRTRSFEETVERFRELNVPDEDILAIFERHDISDENRNRYQYRILRTREGKYDIALYPL